MSVLAFGLMPEMSHAGEHHGEAGFISGCAPHLVLTGKGDKTSQTGGLPPGTRTHRDLAAMVDDLLQTHPASTNFSI